MTHAWSRRRISLVISALVLVALLLVACGGGSDDAQPAASDAPRDEQADAQADAQAQTEAPAAQAGEQTEQAAEETGDAADAQAGDDRGKGGGTGDDAGGAREAAVADGSVQDLAGVQGAVVRIVAEGSFQDPDFGELLNVAGSGSGFIIDESGLVVTNNHVVTGAALLQVYFSGDDANPINARILGVSECSDLAVIDLEGDGYPFLRWHEGVITVGLPAFAGGYPLGDPEFTLTSGIVGKAAADGESNWASVDRVLEHDAAILPGNSGGPLVTDSGRVIGINYAGSDLGQNFAIRADEAQRILDELIANVDVTSIGVNGQAVFVDDVIDGVISGIWVASVASGSPADDLGLRGGDVITRMEGLLLAQDGTMASYCDILRTRGADDILAIEVLRVSTGQVLEGRLNSGNQLSESFSFGDIGGDIGGGVVAGTSYSGFTTVTDDTDSLFVEVPNEWSDVQGGAWVLNDTEVGVSVTAAASIDRFFGVWTEPGVFFGASLELPPNPNVLLDDLRNQFPFDTACEYLGREPYEDPLYVGLFDAWENCGGEDVLYISVVALPPDEAFVINVQVQVVTEADFEALDRILNSFFVEVPGNVAAPPAAGPTGYQDFVEIRDDSGNISVTVPAAWSDVDGRFWEVGGADVGISLTAAQDVARWQATWDDPGIFIGASTTFGSDPEGYLNGTDFSGSCDYVGRETYQDPLYTGFQDIWTDCGGVGTTFIVVAAVPDDGAFIVEVQMTLVSDADAEALERALASFVVDAPG